MVYCNALQNYRLTIEYFASIVLDLTAHIFLKNDKCALINYRQWRGIVQLSQNYKDTPYNIESVKTNLIYKFETDRLDTVSLSFN